MYSCQEKSSYLRELREFFDCELGVGGGDSRLR